MRFSGAPRRALVAAAMAAVVVTGTVISAAGGATANQTERAQALADDRPIDFSSPSGSWSGSGLDARATEIARRIPLPRGGNFSGVRWRDLGDASDEDVIFILQFNAACQWLRAASEGRTDEGDNALLDALVGWPAIRDGGYGDDFARARTGTTPRVGPDDTLLGACLASHEREVAYARSRGLDPPG